MDYYYYIDRYTQFARNQGVSLMRSEGGKSGSFSTELELCVKKKSEYRAPKILGALHSGISTNDYSRPNLKNLGILLLFCPKVQARA